MRKFFTIFGSALLGVAAVIAVSIALLYAAGKRLDRESKAYVDEAVPAIITAWDLEELKKRASQELENAVDFDEVEEYFQTLSDSLGKFQSYNGSTGQSTISIALRYGYEITADYTATAVYEAGTAQVEILIIKLDGRWQVLDFRVTPQEFSEDNTIV